MHTKLFVQSSFLQIDHSMYKINKLIIYLLTQTHTTFIFVYE